MFFTGELGDLFRSGAGDIADLHDLGGDVARRRAGADLLPDSSRRSSSNVVPSARRTNNTMRTSLSHSCPTATASITSGISSTCV